MINFMNLFLFSNTLAIFNKGIFLISFFLNNITVFIGKFA